MNSIDTSRRLAVSSEVSLALQLIAIIFAFIGFLVVLRVIVNLLIDIAMAGDLYPFWQLLSKLRRFLCPWLSPRTQPQGAGTVTPSPASNLGMNTVSMDRLLAGMTYSQKEACLAAILPSQVATKEELERWKTDNERQMHSIPSSTSSMAETGAPLPRIIEQEEGTSSSQDHALLCSICIHDMEPGQKVVILPMCKHRFHSQCLAQWLCTHTRECPYCRSHVFTQEQLDQAYEMRMRNPAAFASARGGGEVQMNRR
eukprot:Nitzschia sp. Nitz4//scaffold1_size375055//204096//204949//NITZ4_000280-RA/size375055-augustus-gene-0.678-mRNA-1//1//CDS//3329541057//416//frame0